DKSGASHRMAGLLPHETRLDRPKRVLSDRRLTHRSPLPFPAQLTGHEYHYSSARRTHGARLFEATDATGDTLPLMGLVDGNVMGSYAHVIDIACSIRLAEQVCVHDPAVAGLSVAALRVDLVLHLAHRAGDQDLVRRAEIGAP